MECLPDTDTLSFCLQHYGSFALFGLLILGIIALPVPEETMMVIAGVLMHKGKLHIPTTLIAAYAGSLCGITVSYIIGRTLGAFFIHKWGRYVGLTEKRFQKAHVWFERYGKWSLFFGYFIPGVRHFTGLLAGMTKLHFKKFALFAYTGAIIWVTTFLSIGYFLDDCWSTYCCDLDLNVIEIMMALIVLAAVIYFIYRLTSKKKPHS